MLCAITSLVFIRCVIYMSQLLPYVCSCAHVWDQGNGLKEETVSNHSTDGDSFISLSHHKHHQHKQHVTSVQTKVRHLAQCCWSWCYIWTGLGVSSLTAGTHNLTPLALTERLLSQWKSDIHLSNTVSAITYCSGTILYKVTIRSRNIWLIYKKLLKGIRKLESKFNLGKIQSNSSE